MSVAQDNRLALTAKERLQLQAAPVKEVPGVYPAASVAVIRNHESLSPSRRIGKFDGSRTGMTFWVSTCTSPIGQLIVPQPR